MFCIVAFLAFLILIALAIIKQQGGRIALFAASACLGMVLAAAQGYQLHVQSESLIAASPVRAYCTLVQDAVQSEHGSQCRVRATFENGEVRTIVLRFNDNVDLLARDTIEARFVVSSPHYDTATYAWTSGASCYAHVSSYRKIERSGAQGAMLDMRRKAIETFSTPSDEDSVLAAIVCGYRPNLSQSAFYNDFKRCGLAHMVAVSGAHMVIVVGLVGTLLKQLKVKRAWSVAVSCAFMLAYLLMSGMPISAVRAVIMASIGMFSYFWKRRPSSINALGLALIVLIAVSPEASVSISLALSALSTMGIVMFMPLASRWVRAVVPSAPRFATDAISLTLAANTMSLPLSCAMFAQLPLVSPLANVITAPLFPVVCAGGILAVLANVMMGAWAQPMIAIVRVGTRAFNILISAVASIPYACVPVSIDVLFALALTGAVAFTLWRFWPAPRVRTIVVCSSIMVGVLVMFALPAYFTDRIVMLDVGQGDAILLQSRGRTMLVDTGNHDDELLRALARQGVNHIDCIAITHADDDHCGSLDALSYSVKVESALVFKGVVEDDDASCQKLAADIRRCTDDVIEVGYHDNVSLGRFSVKVVWPHRISDDAGNSDSLCLLVSANEGWNFERTYTALLTGDAETEQLEDIVEGERISRVSLFKAAHHGSSGSMDGELAKSLNPVITLVSVGANNRYGHPAASTIEALEQTGSIIYRTDEHGDVSCKLTADGIEVATQR